MQKPGPGLLVTLVALSRLTDRLPDRSPPLTMTMINCLVLAGRSLATWAYDDCKCRFNDIPASSLVNHSIYRPS